MIEREVMADEYLKKYSGTENAIKSYKSEFEKMSALAGTGVSDFSNMVNKHKGKLLQEVACLLERQTEIRQCVSQLENKDEQNVLEKRYFDKMTWDMIQRDLSMSKRTAQRLLKKALSHLEIP